MCFSPRHDVTLAGMSRLGSTGPARHMPKLNTTGPPADGRFSGSNSGRKPVATRELPSSSTSGRAGARSAVRARRRSSRMPYSGSRTRHQLLRAQPSPS